MVMRMKSCRAKAPDLPALILRQNLKLSQCVHVLDGSRRKATSMYGGYMTMEVGVSLHTHCVHVSIPHTTDVINPELSMDNKKKLLSMYIDRFMDVFT